MAINIILNYTAPNGLALNLAFSEGSYFFRDHPGSPNGKSEKVFCYELTVAEPCADYGPNGFAVIKTENYALEDIEKAVKAFNYLENKELISTILPSNLNGINLDDVLKTNKALFNLA